MASPVEQHVQLSLFITGGDYAEGNVWQESASNQRIPRETWSLQPWKESLLTPHELPVSSSSQCVPLDEPVVVRGDESRQKAAPCVVVTH